MTSVHRLLFCIPLITLLGVASSSATTITVVDSVARASIGIAGKQNADIEPSAAQASVTYVNSFNGVSATGTSVADMSIGRLGAAVSSSPPGSQSGAAQAEFDLAIDTDEILPDPVWVLVTIGPLSPSAKAQVDLIVGNQTATAFCNFAAIGSCTSSGSLGDFGPNVLALPFIESTNITVELQVGGFDFNFMNSADVTVIIPDGVTIRDSTGFFNNTRPSATPEPSSLILFGTGLSGLGLLLSRRIRSV